MPPRSPLPARFGLDAAWLRTTDGVPGKQPEWAILRDWLDHRVGRHIDVDDFIAGERFVYESGEPVRAGDAYRHNLFVWFHRDLAAEAQVPGEISIVHRDDRLLVVDKPAFLSTIPRGKHVRQSVVVRLRDELGLPELSPMHRLDRVTSGLLVLTTQRRWRGPYQSMFQLPGTVRKTYHAVAGFEPDLELPTTVENHLAKQRGVLQAEAVPGAQPNARSEIAFEGFLSAPEICGLARYDATDADGATRAPLARYRLTPHTGRTHQLRMHMWAAGVPIVGDPLYPVDRDAAIDDFSTPLQLLASGISFTDPVSGAERSFASGLTLPLRTEPLRTETPRP